MERNIARRRNCGPPSTRLLLTTCLCALFGAGMLAPPLFAQTQMTSPATQITREVANACLANQDYDKAIECLNALLVENPADSLSIKADLGLCFKSKKDYAKALQLFAEVAAVKNPRQAEVLYWTDDSFCELGKISQAVEALNNMYATMPEVRGHVLVRRASRLESLGKCKESAADIKELISITPKNETKPLKIQLAALLLRTEGITDDFSAAFDEANYADSSDQLSPELFLSLENQLDGIRLGIEDKLWADGKKEQAVQYLSVLLRDRPKMKADVLTRLSIRHEMLGNAKAIAADMAEFVKSFPNDERAKLGAIKAMEYSFKGSGDCEESQTALQKALEIINTKSSGNELLSLKNELGLALIRSCQLDKAETMFKALLVQYPQDDQLKINLGLCYRGKSDFKQAMPLLEEVVNAGQGDYLLEAICRYEDCLTDQYKYTDAVSYLSAKNNEYPEYGATLLTRKAKWLADKLDRFADAISDYEELIRLFPTRPEAKSAELNIADISVFGLRDFASAKSKLFSYMTRYPVDMDTIVAYHDLGYCNYLSGDYSDAAKTFMEGIQYPDPGNYRPLMLSLAIGCYKTLGEPDKAADAARRLLTGFPDDCWSKVTLGLYPEYAALKP